MSENWENMNHPERIEYLRDKSERIVALVGTVETKLKRTIAEQEAKLTELARQVAALRKNPDS